MTSPSCTSLLTPLGQIASGPVDRNGATREGALPAASHALTDSLDALSFLRPYVTLEGVSGWFDDFGHSGVYDANGSIARIAALGNLFTASIPNPLGLGGLLPDISLGSLIDQTNLNSIPGLDVGFTARCPGSNERGQTTDQLTYNGTIDCDPTEVPTGP